MTPKVDARPRARDDLHGGGVAIIGFVGANALALVFATLALAAGAAHQSVTLIVASLTGLWIGFAVTARVVARRNGSSSLAVLGLVGSPVKELVAGIAAGIVARVAAGQVAVVLWTLLPHPTGSRPSGITSTTSASTTGLVILAVCVCVGSPIFEEIFFRGVVQSILIRRYGPQIALVGQAILFGLVHYQIGMGATQATITIASIFTAGLVLGWLRWHYGRLGAGMVAHSTFNLIAVLALLSLR